MNPGSPTPNRAGAHSLMNNRTLNHAALVESAKHGNQASLEALVDIFHPEIFHLVYSRVGSRMESEDLAQEIFVEMSRKLPKLRDPARFKTWLYRIALNRVRDFHRKRRLWSFLPISSVEESTQLRSNGDAFEQMMEKEFWQQLRRLTGELSRKEREVFILRYLDELTIREIGETLSISESTVKTHLYRALGKFKEASQLRALLKGSLSWKTKACM